MNAKKELAKSQAAANNRIKRSHQAAKEEGDARILADQFKQKEREKLASQNDPANNNQQEQQNNSNATEEPPVETEKNLFSDVFSALCINSTSSHLYEELVKECASYETKARIEIFKNLQNKVGPNLTDTSVNKFLTDVTTELVNVTH